MASAAAASSKHHILIVEDHQGIADMLVQMLSESGHEAAVAVSAGEMDELMAQREFYLDSLCCSALISIEDMEVEMIGRRLLKRFIVTIAVISTNTLFSPALAQNKASMTDISLFLLHN
ncbi:MAG: hypothetical protein ACFCUR_18950 [Rhodomicrobiaceae bacterium]